MVLRKLDNHMQKRDMGLKKLIYTTQKVNSKWIKDLNIKPETIKLEKKNKKKFLDTDPGNGFYRCDTINTQAIKAKINMWYDIQLRSFCSGK